jgi:hypothetical protein
MPLQNVQSLVAVESPTATSSPAKALLVASEAAMNASARQRKASALCDDGALAAALVTSVLIEAIVMTCPSMDLNEYLELLEIPGGEAWCVAKNERTTPHLRSAHR